MSVRRRIFVFVATGLVIFFLVLCGILLYSGLRKLTESEQAQENVGLEQPLSPG